LFVGDYVVDVGGDLDDDVVGLFGGVAVEFDVVGVFTELWEEGAVSVDGVGEVAGFVPVVAFPGGGADEVVVGDVVGVLSEGGGDEHGEFHAGADDEGGVFLVVHEVVVDDVVVF